MIIDTAFHVYTDAGGGDPDLTSPTLRKYHRTIWSKELPNGAIFDLKDDNPGYYLYHSSRIGEFSLGSDAIWHTYRNQKRKSWLINQVEDEANDFFLRGGTIGGYIIFPNKKRSGKFTINQARGINRFIDDRFDLTLECIRRYYLNEASPLYETLLRYKDYFDLFNDFEGYVKFFLLDDLVDKQSNVKFYLPFDGFQTRPVISSISDYLKYKEGVLAFIECRNRRIDTFIKERS